MDHAAQLAELIAAGRRGDAVAYFQGLVGIPADLIAQYRQAPFWPALERIAHTLVYEMTIIGDGAIPPGLASRVTIPTLVIDGGDSPPFLRSAAEALTAALPNAQRRSLAGQTHDLVPAVLAPVLREFFGS